MNHADEHELLIEAGLALHEDYKYSEALPLFRMALAAAPECVSAQYNVANTLHMLGQDAEASGILKNLLKTSDDTFVRGCPLQQNPQGFKLDALFLLFLTTLSETESWEAAFPYAQQHLAGRITGHDSVFSDQRVADEIESLKNQFDR